MITFLEKVVGFRPGDEVIMVMKHFIPYGILTLTLASCTSVRVVEKAPRDPVRFANAEAADTFYRALIAETTPHNDESEFTVALYVTSPFRHKKVPNDDKQFNRAAAEADSNANGIITLREAQRYAMLISGPSEA